MLRRYKVVANLWILILALFLIFPLSACQSPQPVQKVTLRFAYPSQFSSLPAVDQILVDRYKALAAAFHEQNPNITVELVPQTWEQTSALTARDFDVLLLGSYFYADFTSRGVLRSLAPWMSLGDKAWSGDYLPSVLKPFERNGELWAIPWALDPLILYYNRGLFSQNGVEAPKPGWTWSDFLVKAHALTDIANGVYGSMIMNQYALAPSLIYQHGGQLFDDWSQPTQATFDNPRNIEALSWLASLIYEYNVMPTLAQSIRQYGSGVYALSTGIYKGKFGMWAAQYTERGGAIWVPEDAWKVPWGAAPLPRDAQAATMVQAYLIGISSQAADADACWQWLAFLSKQLPPDLFLPARTSLRAGLHPEDVSEREALAAGSTALEGVLLISADMGEKVRPAADALWKAVDAVLQKNASAEEQLQQAQQKATQ